MDTASGRLAVVDTARTAVVFAVVATLCDVLVVATAYQRWRSFNASPKTVSLQPQDDPAFAVSGVVFGFVSALRYLALLGLVIALLSVRLRARQAQRAGSAVASTRPLLLFGGIAVAIELGYLVVSGSQSNPTAFWFTARTVTCIVSAFVAVLIIVTLRPLSRARDENIALATPSRA